MLVSVGCLVSKEMLDLVVSTVVMVVTARKVQLVSKALLVQRVLRVSKVLLAHAENVVKMAVMVQKERLVFKASPVLRASMAWMVSQG